MVECNAQIPLSRMRITLPQLMDALPLHRCLAHRHPCPPSAQRTHSFTPQLSEQLSSAIKLGPTTLANGIQCPLGGNVLCLTVGSKTSTGNIKDSHLEGTPQLLRIPKNTENPQIPIQPVHKVLISATFSSLSLPTSSQGWDGTIVLDLSCNFKVDTSLWSALRN